MWFHVLACDFDGTLAQDGRIAASTFNALRALEDTGRRVLLVTGRRLGELLSLLADSVDIFDRVVAENGAVIYNPATKESRCVAEPPPQAFVDALLAAGVRNIEVGKAIVATWSPYEDIAFRVIKEQGLGLQVIMNKDAVMILPSGVSKATGLQQALHEIGYSARNAVAVGDAENDHAMLELCECGAAVQNAVQSLKDRADILLTGDHGLGVEELISMTIRTDLKSWAPRGELRISTEGGRDKFPHRLHLLDGVSELEATSQADLEFCIKELVSAVEQQQFQWCGFSEFDWLTLKLQDQLSRAALKATSTEQFANVLDKPQQNVFFEAKSVFPHDRGASVSGFVNIILRQRFATGRPHVVFWVGAAEGFENIWQELQRIGPGLVLIKSRIAAITQDGRASSKAPIASVSNRMSPP